jgi:hypothetical protein
VDAGRIGHDGTCRLGAVRSATTTGRPVWNGIGGDPIVVLRFAGEGVAAEAGGRFALGGKRRDAEGMFECRIDDRLFPFGMCEDGVALAGDPSAP